MTGIGPETGWKCLNKDEGETVLQILGLFQIKWDLFFLNENWKNLAENFKSGNGLVVGIGLLMSCELD